MTPLKIALLGAAASLGLAAPAAAQMNHANMPGMNMPGMTMPMPAKKPAAKKPAAKKPAAKKPAAKTTAAKKAPAKKAATKAPAKKAAPTKADPHAGHDMSSMPGMQMPKDQAGSSTSAQSMPGHDMSSMPGMTMPQGQQGATGTQGMSMPGHDMSTMPGMTMPQGTGSAAQSAPQPTQSACPPEHAAMGHCTPSAAPGSSQVAEGTNLPAGTAPPPPMPIANAADAFYGTLAMEMGRHHLQQFHGGQKFFQVLNNITEARIGKGANGYGWETEGWYGGDINRFWFKTEGEGSFREGVESAEVQALYSHAIDPYWNIQGGLRYDFKPNPSRVYATVQLEGLAPSFFDVEGALFLSNKGEVMARASGWYDQRITQRLILQPRVELDFAAQNSREIGVGAGLSKVELGARVRYDIKREFAPYIGVQYERAVGRSARYRRDEGEDAGGFQFLVGVRTWF